MYSWARFKFEGKRCNILTTNIVESMNSFMRESQNFFITHLVDHFKKTLQQWLYNRTIMTESISTYLTTWANEIVDEMRILTKRMIVHPVSQ